MTDYEKGCFAEDLAEVLGEPTSPAWAVAHTGDLEVKVTIIPPKEPKESYLARLLWSTYPDGKPSLKFLDGADGRDDNSKAWPVGNGMRAATRDSCMQWTLEGQGLHPEWARVAAYKLDTKGNVLKQALGYLRRWFNTEYQGRFQG